MAIAYQCNKRDCNQALKKKSNLQEAARSELSNRLKLELEVKKANLIAEMNLLQAYVSCDRNVHGTRITRSALVKKKGLPLETGPDDRGNTVA